MPWKRRARATASPIPARTWVRRGGSQATGGVGGGSRVIRTTRSSVTLSTTLLSQSRYLVVYLWRREQKEKKTAFFCYSAGGYKITPLATPPVSRGCGTPSISPLPARRRHRRGRAPPLCHREQDGAERRERFAARPAPCSAGLGEEERLGLSGKLVPRFDVHLEALQGGSPVSALDQKTKGKVSVAAESEKETK